MAQSRSAVHRCLNIAEVQQMIVDFASETRATVAALALTCRAFHESAQNALWERQVGLANLLRCFPPSVWENSNGSSTILVLRRPPFPEEWMRFLRNAARVREMHVGAAGRNVDPDAFQALATYRPQLHVFSNLKSLHWNDDDDVLWQHLPLFLSPSLRQLWISFEDEPLVTYAPAIKMVPVSCPALEVFAMRIKEDTFDVWEDLSDEHLLVTSDVVSALPHLTECHCSVPLSFAAVTYLTQLPALRAASLKVEQDITHAGFAARSSVFLPALEELDIEIYELNAGACDQLVLAAQSERLAKVTLATANAPNAEQFECFCRDLVNRPAAARNLTSLTLKFPKTYAALPGIPAAIADRPDMALTIDALSLLFPLTSLTVLDLNSFYLDLDDAAIELLVATLPGLTTLRLLPNHRANPSTYKVTTTSLVTCAQGLPHLKHLGLAFDTAIKPYSVNPHEPPVQMCSDLYVADSSLARDQAENMALFLSAFFWDPRMQIHVATDEEMPLFRGGERIEQLAVWARVQELFAPMVLARGQERAGMVAWHHRFYELGLPPPTLFRNVFTFTVTPS